MPLVKSFKVLGLIGLAAALLLPYPCQAETAAPATDDATDLLRRYVSRPEDVFGFEVAHTFSILGADGYVLNVTSQKWRDIEWNHWLFVVVPKLNRHPDKALLIVEGGRNRQEVPQLDAAGSILMSTLSNQIGATIALLQQVPNQPLKGGLREDALIAYTFDQYIQTGESDYPLLFPMVKSAVAAMDAIGLWSQQHLDKKIEDFFVAGASKRGWTTWLTAAVDDRVTAIAPLVIDVLNMQPQMEQQLKTYGRYSPMISDYVDRGVLGNMDSERGRTLMEIVDPYSYRKDITVPKLIVLGTNDPYWTVDAANLYVPGLVGPTWVHYSPNAGHSLTTDSIVGLSSTILSMGSFIRMHFADQQIPTINWHHDASGRLIVTWEDPNAKASLWTAQSPNRDFRKAKWLSRPLQGHGRVEVDLPQPESGWQAWFVELAFGGQYPIRLTTTMTVLPDTFPHEGRHVSGAAAGIQAK